MQDEEDKEHEVVFSPPYYSDLQPIEIIWTIVKDRMGHQYTINITFVDVLVRLQEVFND